MDLNHQEMVMKMAHRNRRYKPHDDLPIGSGDE